MKELIGKIVRINVYGSIYDGTVVSVDDGTITLEEDCGSSKLVKIIFISNIAAIETRFLKN